MVAEYTMHGRLTLADRASYVLATMPISRRQFFQATSATAVGSLLAPYISGRGLEAFTGTSKGSTDPFLLVPTDIRLNSNENPNGCAPDVVSAMTQLMGETNRYPRATTAHLTDAIAASFNVKPENVVLGTGSTDILRAAVNAYCGKDRALVTASPSFENPAEDAKRIGAEVRAIPVTGNLKLDLAAMAAAAKGAGLVYLCNPNNPTSTVHGADAVAQFIADVMKASPRTTILVDEAYHEYVDDKGYATALPVAMSNPRVFIARTFSKVHGLAGMRVGYAIGQATTMAEIAPQVLNAGVSQLAAFGAMTALGLSDHVERERLRNREARAMTTKAFADMGFRVAESNANFVMIDLKRDAQPFRDACKAAHVIVGRPFPPLDTWIRISIGTKDEMTRSIPIFRRSLAQA
jgi:histidinol-phosphate aminotransferase